MSSTLPIIKFAFSFWFSINEDSDDKSSNIKTSSPELINISTKLDPTNPKPPVTKDLINPPLFLSPRKLIFLVVLLLHHYVNYPYNQQQLIYVIYPLLMSFHQNQMNFSY